MFSRMKQALLKLELSNLIGAGVLNIRIKCSVPQSTKKAKESTVDLFCPSCKIMYI